MASTNSDSNNECPLSALQIGGLAAVAGVAAGFLASKFICKPEPHWNTEPKICDTILDHIGNTPLVRLHRVSKHLDCEMLAKCEFFNAGGSVKDRIGKRMVQDAANSGRIKKGDILIEPTSGNTGIGLSLAAAVMGYRMVITLPKKMSSEKVLTLQALGAIVKRTPTNAPCTEGQPGYEQSHIAKAKAICADLNSQNAGSAHILDQYSNPSNPLAHIEGTAQEIYRQCDGKLDMVVLTAGTGGTIAGVAYALKKLLPNIIVVGVDPIGSILSENDKLVNPEAIADEVKDKPYAVEGIGYDFIPQVLSNVTLPDGRVVAARGNLIDKWVKTEDTQSFIMARRLIREEGLLCGGSSGSAMVGALLAAKELKKGQRCVVLLADSVRNYMRKFLDNEWMTPFADEKDYVYKPDINTHFLQRLSCEDTWALEKAVEEEEAAAAAGSGGGAPAAAAAATADAE